MIGNCEKGGEKPLFHAQSQPDFASVSKPPIIFTYIGNDGKTTFLQKLLEETGVEAANNTVGRMREVEERAAASLGAEIVEQYAELYREFFCALRREFQKEGLADE